MFLSADWYPECVFKALLKTSLLYWGPAAREWQNALFVVQQTVSAEEMLNSTWDRNYEVRACLGLCFLCVCCVWRTRTAVTVSNEHVYVAFDFCLSCSVAPPPHSTPPPPPLPPLSLLLSLSYVVFCLACSCALWQQKRADASINVYCVRLW